MDVKLYTTGCPKCKVLATKLDTKSINYEVVDDEQVMIDKGFMEAPMLEVDGSVMNFSAAINWLKEV